MSKLEVIELCPHCGSEIELIWDTNEQGYETVCPVCGNRIMLCDECLHSQSAAYCDYDNITDRCHRRKDGGFCE